ncbi:syntaxin-3 [Capsaspora owczarzaki ATCC 30864]|uniref:Syntaxin-3 n=1 Tax=Capsaspora owczarzaki (strain ATCC 30864) TaxID=595528 RepID=A0A0D2UN27_CAPO3|nr:syntaxin-3 [Capsaspora owczarzaki ATCC 30864]KJE96436.1 syntaxin-3 [Capsaspora owczarzaki ATCC 30864]|eukprot:XP_004344383.2 syntaxin-3 [Capsaspora owczarzaki ATCC 30864]
MAKDRLAELREFASHAEQSTNTTPAGPNAPAPSPPLASQQPIPATGVTATAPNPSQPPAPPTGRAARVLAQIKSKLLPQKPEDAPPPILMQNLLTDEEEIMNDFMARTNLVRASIARIDAAVDRLQQDQDASLASVNHEITLNLRQSIDRTTSAIQLHSSDTRTQLKELSTFKSHPSLNEARRKIVNNQRSLLLQKFMESLTRFQESQVRHKKMYRDRIQRQMLIVKPDASPEEVDAVANDLNEPPALFQQQLTDEFKDTREALVDIQDRHREIERLERSMLELTGLFADLAVLVEEQGQALDSIELNMAQTEAAVSQATTELRTARRIQRKIRTKQIIIGIIILCIIAAIVIPIVLTAT